MNNLTLIFDIGQKVVCNFDGALLKGTVTQVEPNHIIVDVPKVSDHCMFELGFNMDMVHPSYYC